MKQRSAKLLRSVLFAPSDRLKVLEKSLTLDADVVIFDLEDSVAPTKKDKARNDLYKFIESTVDKTTKVKMQLAVRINCPLTTSWGKDDLNMMSKLPFVDAIVLPKVSDVSSLNKTINILGTKPFIIWAMIESCQGLINCDSISSHDYVEALILGGNDLTKDMKAKFMKDRKHLYHAMSKTVTASRAANKYVIDAVYMDIKDNDGLRKDCELGRDFGFDGKSLIHPDQISITNSVFSPSTEELQYAKRVVEVWKEAVAAGQSVALLDGKLIEYLHVHEANALIATASIINSKRYDEHNHT